MRLLKYLLIASLALAPLPIVSAGWFPLVQSGGGGGCTAGTFGTTDGTMQAIHNASASSLTLPAFSTTNCPDIVYIHTGNNNATETSTTVTGCGLTWTKRARDGNGSATNFLELWTAQAATALTNCQPVVTFAAAGSATAVIFAFNNIHTAAPFDSNAAIPNTPNSAVCTFTTSNANDILIATGASASTTPDTGFTLIRADATDLFFSEYKSVTSTQSTTAAASTNTAAICDAIIQGP